jgi:hypothetical protein
MYAFVSWRLTLLHEQTSIILYYEMNYYIVTKSINTEESLQEKIQFILED